MKNNPGKLLILTGERGAGKTTLCQFLVNMLQKKGEKLSGILSPAVFVDGVKVGINALDLTTGVGQKLAVYNPEPKAVKEGEKPLHWSFDPLVIKWGNQVFEKAVPTRFLIVDEIGPLELERGTGWLEALTALDSRQYHWAILIMRPELLNAAQQRWPWHTVFNVVPGSDPGETSTKISKLFYD